MSKPGKKDYKGFNITPRHRKFVRIYNGNAAEAAENAGFCRAHGAYLIKHPVILRMILDREDTDPETRKLIADKEELQKFWTNVVRGEEEITIITKDGKEITTSPEMKDRLKASELAGKSQAVFVDKQVVDTGDNLSALLEEISGATRGLPRKPKK